MSTILIVDDDGETCRFMAELLGRPDREIRTTQHVAEALTLARQSFDLLISDINLDAQQNGMDVLRAFKQGNPRGHVVLISGFGTLQTAIDAVRAGRNHLRLRRPEQAARKHFSQETGNHVGSNPKLQSFKFQPPESTRNLVHWDLSIGVY